MDDLDTPTPEERRGRCGPSKERVKLRHTWRDYCKSTSIHGVQYIVEKDRSTTERVFWVLALALCFAGCAALTTRMYSRWVSTPTVVPNELRTQPIWNIPFPAFTICPNIKCRQSAFNFTAAYRAFLEGALDSEQTERLATVSVLCDEHRVHGGKDFLSEEDFEFLQMVAPTLTDSLAFCKYHGEVKVLCPDFYPTMTEEGLCFSYNMLSATELFTEAAVQFGWNGNGEDGATAPSSRGWTLQDGYVGEQLENITTYPFRALSSGAAWGVNVVVQAQTADMDYMCRGPVQGLKVMLHNPHEVPHMRRDSFPLVLKEEVVVTVKASMMTASDGLRSSDLSLRRCYFPDERRLEYFQVYSQNNCELECSSKFAEKYCRCVAFYMPRSNGTPICGPGSFDCLRAAEERMVARDIEEEQQHQGQHHGVEEPHCHCLPACTTLKYEIDTSTTTREGYDWPKVVQAYKLTNNTIIQGGMQLSRVVIYFKNAQVVVTQRNELYTSATFFAGCASLLGLFSGFSLVNVIEILYFASLRLVVNVYKKYWNGAGSGGGVERATATVSHVEKYQQK